MASLFGTGDPSSRPTRPAPPTSTDSTNLFAFAAPGGPIGAGAGTGARRTSRWVSLARACEILGVNESTVRRWADAGEIQMFRTPGGHRRFDEGDLLGLVERGARRPDREIESATVSRIRRQLHGHGESPEWYRETDEDERDALRPLGRRLVQIVDDYLGHRGDRAALEREVTEIGGSYGRELMRRGTPLAQAVQAFTFFRKALDQTAKQLATRNHMSADEAAVAREQIAILADRVLLALTSVYDVRGQRPPN
ncbi:MAG: helix-turn-helix domain-containing protein [Dehalococcoidia bacterium]